VRGATDYAWYIKLFHRFQSTLPVRGATEVVRVADVRLKISIHAPRAGSDCKPGNVRHNFSISIHAPRAGSDKERKWEQEDKQISIHAPRAGSDGMVTFALLT